MKPKRSKMTIPDPLLGLLSRMGSDLSAARRAQAITQDDMAGRLNVARRTLIRMERGDPTVSLGAYATAAWVLGLEERFLSGFHPGTEEGREARLALPKRVRQPAADLDF
ncbi:helix-turn-helix protein [Gemmobacter caeni]|uniref:Helix-turn-helix protein n=1 Tax=Gemmobacter caeni TaxID=589035 RepID=A0A2T6B8L0_9RHOB|nr:helix-turn-helix domain-containing protein [Gemmobacter caeni]PTX52358.1 helix-turn-helix protein [Gemmobacter caeni]TWJ02730.1 helix-turn-helix protein [Gemmobacter caeni]